MNPALRTAASGMLAQQTRTEVIANNLANVNTTGFKRSRAHFVDLLYQTVQGVANIAGADADSTPAVQIGRGTRLAAVTRLHANGPLEATNRPLDIAIEGEGFLQVQMENGTIAYTRDGSLQISDQGVLVTSGGLTVVPGVRVPADATTITISRAGIVTAARAGDTVPQEVGRIEVSRFANASGLESMGENLYIASPASGEPTVGFPGEEGFGRILQGHLESSNVEIVQEMVDMIAAMRAYEINSKTIQNVEQMSDVASGLIR
jgi:flagellar basal-body rod protein FlgG